MPLRTVAPTFVSTRLRVKTFEALLAKVHVRSTCRFPLIEVSVEVMVPVPPAERPE